jgi:hypothetical protein
LADCLGEDSVPPAYELEEHFRSGILLARLANYFAPDLVSLEKIFDLDEVCVSYNLFNLLFLETLS